MGQSFSQDEIPKKINTQIPETLSGKIINFARFVTINASLEKEQIVLSPFSIYYVMQLFYLASTKETADQLKKPLFVSNNEEENPQSTFLSASQYWIKDMEKEGLKIVSNFEKTLFHITLVK